MKAHQLIGLTAQHDAVPPRPVPLQCPACGKHGTFEPIDESVRDVRLLPADMRLGQRKCPNRACRALVFVECMNDVVVASYPPTRIDFESVDLPERVRAAMTEAITCHSVECYRAAGVMLRRTLEELCEDRGATGANLHQRLLALRGAVVLPTDLLDSLNELRLFGNDATHVELKDFDQIGKPEVEAAMELIKEILKSVYQMKQLRAKLAALKRTTTT